MKKASFLLLVVLATLLTVSFAVVWGSPPSALDLSAPPAPGSGLVTETSTALKWEMEEVDVPRSIYPFSDRFLQVDGDGHAHLVYGGDHLYYARHDGLGWNIQTVDDSPMVGSCASLALDGNGRPHIAYLDDYNERIKYATWTGSQWRIETVADTIAIPQECASIAIDPAGSPGIAFYGQPISDEWDHHLYFARPNGGNWQASLVRNGTGLWLVGPSLDFDQAGRPHVAFAEYPMVPEAVNHVRLAHWTGSAWAIDTIFSSDTASISSPSLVLDSQDRPHLAFAASDVIYAYWTGSQWDMETILPGELWGSYGTITSLVLDQSNQPYIAMRGNYVAKHNGAWAREEIISPGYVISIALDPLGQPCIAGNDWEDNTDVLMFVRREGDAWTYDNVDERGRGVDSGLSFGLDGNQAAHLAYQSLGLRYTREVSPSWAMEGLSTSAWSLYDGLALDSQDRPHIAYSTWATENEDGLGLAHWTGSEWTHEVVDLIPNDDAVVALRLDSQDRPHLAYICPEFTDICYAYWNGSEWVKQVVDSHGFGNLSLALDSQDRPHLVYQDYEWTSQATWEYYLIYASWDGSAWQKETVSSGSWVRYTSLVLDANDVPHLAFWDDPWTDSPDASSSLQYTIREAGAWHFETVHDGPGKYASLRLDSQGKPHLAFVSSVIHYAHRQGAHWLAREIGRAKGDDICLVLDQNDWPHIAFLRDNLSGVYILRPAPIPLTEEVFLPFVSRQ